MTDHEQARRAARHSLRNVVSIRDFLLAVQVGSETAVAMLDKIESKILRGVGGNQRGRAMTKFPAPTPTTDAKAFTLGGVLR
jgi:hypothetical protein